MQQKENSRRKSNFQSWVEKHRDHVQKLETLLRMLDNDQVEVQQIKDIQEDIDNYIENSQEPDFFENEFIYEDIEGLEEMLLDVMLNVVTNDNPAQNPVFSLARPSCPR